MKKTTQESPSIDELFEPHIPKRKSGVVVRNGRNIKKKGRGKRSVMDMLASYSTDAEKAAYAGDRIASLEDQIANILKALPASARALVLKEHGRLKLYAPEE